MRRAAELLVDEDRAWSDLLDAFERLSPMLEAPGLTPDGWSAKDAMFHIGAWMADCANQLERMRLGTFEDRLDTVTDIDRMNREWFEQSRAMDPETVRAEFIAAHQRMLAEWAELSEITAAAWEWLEESGPIHYRKHLTDLRAWAARPG